MRSRRERITVAVAVVLLGGLLTFLQGAPSSAVGPSFPALGWWFTPVMVGEAHEEIGCDLRAVAASDPEHVWIAGAVGFVAASRNGGRTWTRLLIGKRTGDADVNGGQGPNRELNPSRPQPPATPPATPQQASPPSGPKGAWLQLIEGTAQAESPPSPAPPVPPAPEEPAQANAAVRSSGPAALPEFISLDLQGGPDLISDEAVIYAVTQRQTEVVRSKRIEPYDEFTALGGNLPLLAAQGRKQGTLIVNGRGQLFGYPAGGRGSVIYARGKKDEGKGYRAAFLAGDLTLFAVDEMGNLEQSSIEQTGRSGGSRATVTHAASSADNGLVNVQGLFFLEDGRGWAVGTLGRILTTSDGGVSWRRQSAGDTPVTLRAVTFLPDGQHGWSVGDQGTVLGTADGGATWTALTTPHVPGTAPVASRLARPWRLPAPWYFLSLLALGLVLAPAVRSPAKEDAPPEETVADLFATDRPLDGPRGDVLDLNGIALGLSRFLRNEGTLAPLTVAVTGEWGTGKSSLMNLLRADLVHFGFRPVSFNAWHHQKEEHLLAALLQSIRMQAVPGWLSSDGLMFRLRLMLERGWRFWLSLGTLVFVLALSIAFEAANDSGSQSGPQRAWQVVIDVLDRLKKGELDNALHALGARGAGLGVLGSALGLAAALKRGVRAFGVDPGALLAGVTGSAKPSDLSAKTSFRQTFAAELRQVTTALGVRSMIIFIDDLDRCRPRQVVEMLEAVNFVVSSGDCFVILGMAPERVIPCIALSFKDVAAEMRINAGQPGETPRRKRARFAREYLDKLINIEVPIPTPSVAQAQRLIVETSDAHAPKPAPAAGPPWIHLLGKAVAAGVRQRRIVLPVLVAAAVWIIAWAGLAAGDRLGVQAKHTAEVRATLATTAQERSESPATDSDRKMPAPVLAARPDRTGQTAEVFVGARAVETKWWMVPLAMALFLAVIGWLVVSRRPDPVVRDSGRFSQALRIWNALVFAHRPTPRALKRFLNRVRYVAMRQRSAPRAQSFLDRVLQESAGAPAPAVASSTAAPPLSDEMLVALAALNEANPDAFDGSTPLDQTLTALLAEDPLARSAWAEHVAAFDISLDDLILSAPLYLRHAQTVRAN